MVTVGTRFNAVNVPIPALTLLTTISGVPVNACAFVAVVAVSALPVTLPVKLPLKLVAVTTPVTLTPVLNVEKPVTSSPFANT